MTDHDREATSATEGPGSDGAGAGATEGPAEPEEPAAEAPAEAAAEEEDGGSKAKLPLVAGVAAISAVAGAAVVASRRARKTVLGVKLPRRHSSRAGKLIDDASDQVADFTRKAADLPGVKQVRDRIRRDR